MPQPLTKIVPGGKPYVRPAKVEIALAVALVQDAATLSRRAELGDRRSPEYLASECLVHLIREAGRRGDAATMNVLLVPLLRRCEVNLKTRVPDGMPSTMGEEILSEFAQLFAEDGNGKNPNELDFYEVRFNSAFAALRIDMLRKEGGHLQREVSFPEPKGEEGDEDVLARLAGAFHSPDQEEGLNSEPLADALATLTPDERKAVILFHVMEYEEESEDPNKITAATLCRCTGRTIRNRLRRAAAKITKFMKEDE